jgi:hypothetical protein
MKTTRSWLNSLVFVLILAGSAAAFDDKKGEKSPLPGDAEWELKAFNSLFRVVRTEHDAGANQVKWLVETRDGYRTSDFLTELARNPFVFHFLDGDNEVATVQLSKDDFRGIPGERVMKAGTRLTIILDLPRALPKAKKVVLRRGRS